MNKKKIRMTLRQIAGMAVDRDEQNRRLEWAATTPVREVLKGLQATLCGLDMEAVSASRAQFGSNRVDP